MQRHVPRHFTAYTITAILYLSVIAAIYYAQTQHFVSSKETKEKVIQMSLSTFVPEVKKEIVIEEPIVEEVVKEEPKVEEVVPEPVVEKVPEQPITKKPLAKKPVIKKPVIKKPVIKKPKKIIKKKAKKVKKKVTKKHSKKKHKKKSSKAQASSQQSKSTHAQRNKFWSALRNKIDKHKFYPRLAKKRMMEGAVKVRFTVLANGNVGHITLKGPKIFYNSARNAVKSAFPIDAKKSPVSLPTTINLTLRYQIR